MKLTAVTNMVLLESIIEDHTLKETLSNNYILSNEFAKYIEDKNIFYYESNSNLYLFIKKEGFYRLYFLINNTCAKEDFSKLNIVLEIIYRGKNNMPLEHIKYWIKNGFASHLMRDCYFLKTSSILSDNSQVEGFTIERAKNEDDIIFAKKLIDENLDLYTGDRLSVKEIEHFASRGLLFCAFKNGVFCGMLQADLRNNVYWLGHIVVHKEFRGLGLANALVNHYLQEGLKLQVRQLQLWVIDMNIPAINLYKKKGFMYMNKSIYSLLKTT